MATYGFLLKRKWMPLDKMMRIKMTISLLPKVRLPWIILFG